MKEIKSDLINENSDRMNGFLLDQYEEMIGQSTFKTMDGETLLTTPMEATPFLVSSLIPQGLHIIGGAPKIGKSWLVLWWCLQISKGEPIWNYETKQGTVLYLALEDSFERIQSRLLEITEDAPSCLHVAVLAKSIEDGLDKQIEAFIEKHTDTRLIAIDTLQNIRSPEGCNINPYANDYRELSVLKDLAFRYHIAILLVHHLRKQKDSDPMNMLSGTTGLSGVVDTAFILDRDKRTSNVATLFCTGRDIETVELPLAFSDTKFIWEMRDSDRTEIKMLDEIVAAVHQYFSSVSEDSFEGTATELAEKMKAAIDREIAPAVISKRLLRFNSQFCELGYECNFKRTHECKLIFIKKVCVDASVNEGASPGVNLTVAPTQEGAVSHTTQGDATSHTTHEVRIRTRRT